jgi:hypothetical protein
MEGSPAVDVVEGGVYGRFTLKVSIFTGKLFISCGDTAIALIQTIFRFLGVNKRPETTLK